MQYPKYCTWSQSIGKMFNASLYKSLEKYELPLMNVFFFLKKKRKKENRKVFLGTVLFLNKLATVIRSFTWIIYHWKLRLCLVYFFSSFNFRYSSLKISYRFGTITHLSSFNIFHTICGSHTCHTVQEIFFFSFSITEPSKK